VWPDRFDAAVAASLVLLVAGFVAVMVIHRLAGRAVAAR
jgi:ABC-type sulfate transport system permease component